MCASGLAALFHVYPNDKAPVSHKQVAAKSRHVMLLHHCRHPQHLEALCRRLTINDSSWQSDRRNDRPRHCSVVEKERGRLLPS